MLSYCQCNYC